MRKPAFTFLLILLNISLFPQSIEITVAGSSAKEFRLYSVSGEKTNSVDSVFSMVPGKFSYPSGIKNLRTGLYRLTFDNNKRIDFIFDQNEVVLATESSDPAGKMNIVQSEANRLFYEFLKINRGYKTKSEFLLLIITRYPKEDKFYQQAVERLAELQAEYSQFILTASQKDPQTFAARYIKSAQQPLIPAQLPQQGHLNYLKSHGLDNIDFNDTELTGSDLFTNKSIEYLMYFSNNQLPKELLQKEFCSAVDSILERARINQFVYQHVTEYLISGFRQFGFDVVLDYIVENYVIKDDLCLDEQTGGMIKRRIDQARNLKIGNSAPDFSIADEKGKTVVLSAVKKSKVLLVFYSSQCPHCKELLPQLNDLSKKLDRASTEIIAVSLDSKKDDWISFIRQNCPNLTNLSELKGWEGKASDEYFIYATPSMFLLDRTMKILAKPMTFSELKPLLP